MLPEHLKVGLDWMRMLSVVVSLMGLSVFGKGLSTLAGLGKQ